MEENCLSNSLSLLSAFDENALFNSKENFLSPEQQQQDITLRNHSVDRDIDLVTQYPRWRRSLSRQKKPKCFFELLPEANPIAKRGIDFIENCKQVFSSPFCASHPAFFIDKSKLNESLKVPIVSKEKEKHKDFNSFESQKRPQTTNKLCTLLKQKKEDIKHSSNNSKIISLQSHQISLQEIIQNQMPSNSSNSQLKSHPAQKQSSNYQLDSSKQTQSPQKQYKQCDNIFTYQSKDIQSSSINQPDSLKVYNNNSNHNQKLLSNKKQDASLHLKSQIVDIGSDNQLFEAIGGEKGIIYSREGVCNHTIKCSLWRIQEIKKSESGIQTIPSFYSGKLDDLIKNNINQLDQANQDALRFESRFESGNLALAGRVGPHKYNLIVQNDINTKGFTQWFCFSVSKAPPNIKIQFNLLNFYKKRSLFQDGMRISIFTDKKGWFKGGEDILYQCNGIQKGSNKSYYTLQFSFTFQESEELVFFSYNVPYTYTHLSKFIGQCETESQSMNIFNRKLLCRTAAGNRVDLITITNPFLLPETAEKKRGIVITARVHPGETVSSHIMQGIISYLLSSDNKANSLRNKFVFKVIPMLNPDGVIHGNYRCSLTGTDLNRKWKSTSEQLHPEIFHTKKMIAEFHEKNPIALIIDLHGHSYKRGVFAYGCHDKKNPFASREFPFIFSKITPSFSFKECNFKVQKSKEGTARISMYRQLGIPDIFTVECSFCGPQSEDYHFSLSDLYKIGEELIQVISLKFKVGQDEEDADKLTLNNVDSPNECQNNSHPIPDKKVSQQKIFLEELYQNKQLIEIGMRDESESDSEPSGDNLSDNELKTLMKFKKQPKQKKLNSKDLSLSTISNISNGLSQTQAILKKRYFNFSAKPMQRKQQSIVPATPIFEKKEKVLLVKQPVKSKTLIKGATSPCTSKAENQPKVMVALEPKFVYFPINITDAFKDNENFKQKLKEMRMKKLKDLSSKQQGVSCNSSSRISLQQKLKQQGIADGIKLLSSTKDQPEYYNIGVKPQTADVCPSKLSLSAYSGWFTDTDDMFQCFSRKSNQSYCKDDAQEALLHILSGNQSNCIQSSIKSSHSGFDHGSNSIRKSLFKNTFDYTPILIKKNRSKSNDLARSLISRRIEGRKLNIERSESPQLSLSHRNMQSDNGPSSLVIKNDNSHSQQLKQLSSNASLFTLNNQGSSNVNSNNEISQNFNKTKTNLITSSELLFQDSEQFFNQEINKFHKKYKSSIDPKIDSVKNSRKEAYRKQTAANVDEQLRKYYNNSNSNGNNQEFSYSLMSIL